MGPAGRTRPVGEERVPAGRACTWVLGEGVRMRPAVLRRSRRPRARAFISAFGSRAWSPKPCPRPGAPDPSRMWGWRASPSSASQSWLKDSHTCPWRAHTAWWGAHRLACVHRTRTDATLCWAWCWGRPGIQGGGPGALGLGRCPHCCCVDLGTVPAAPGNWFSVSHHTVHDSK